MPVRTLGKKYVLFGGMLSPVAATSRTRSTGRRAHEERRLGRAGLDALARLGGVARVLEPVQVRDVVLAHAERALQHERLQHGGVEARGRAPACPAARRRRSPGRAA